MKYVFANWKMYLNLEQSRELAEQLIDISCDNSQMTGVVFPNTLFFQDVSERLKNTAWRAGAQSVSWTPQGAYTGAVSAHLFAESGAEYALVGHSERRYIFGETNDDVRKKLESCINEKLIPVLCVGETKEDRDAHKVEYRIKKQLLKACEGLDLDTSRIMIAYEPVWAIGTGDACDPEEAMRMISLIKAEMMAYTDAVVPVLYGGSVDQNNVVLYLSSTHIDGVLVGSASARIDSLRALMGAVSTYCSK